MLWYSGFLLEPMSEDQMAIGHETARATWPWREKTSAPCKCGPLGKKERERELLRTPGLIYLGFGKEQKIFPNGQLTFQVFCGLLKGPTPS